MGNKSDWKEEAERETYELLARTFGQNNIQPEPKVNNKKAEFLITTGDIYVEVYSVKDVTSDIRKETPYPSPRKGVEVKNIEIPKEKLLDRLAGKVQHECNQFPDGAKNVLVVKTEELHVSPSNVVDVFMEPSLLIDRKTMETEIKYRHYFRTEEEKKKVLEKISAVITYEGVCHHGKLRGVFADNKNNAEVPLNQKERVLFEGMICNKCA